MSSLTPELPHLHSEPTAAQLRYYTPLGIVFFVLAGKVGHPQNRGIFRAHDVLKNVKQRALTVRA